MIYSKLFYAIQRHGSHRSAEVILPLVFEGLRPASVIDVGCGVGTWLAVAGTLGSAKLVGLEGQWVSSVTQVPGRHEIRYADLETAIPDGERYDLAICLEVAEHLSPARAETFVAELCTLSKNILFSAAIPWQGGTRHLNERPQSYWAELFRKHRYGAQDIVRPRVWYDGRVSYWYRQNTFLYIKDLPEKLAFPVDRIHPLHYANPWRVAEAWDRLRGKTSPQGQY